MKDIKDYPQAKFDQKSGLDFSKMPAIHGGMPPKKSVDEIDRENMPKNAPGSTASGS